jgi:type II secretory pathway pseudopilin PulG
MNKKKIAIWVLGILLLIGSIWFTEHYEFDNLDNNMVRAQTVVNAVKQYESVYGKPPEDLGALVPRFLPKVPTTVRGTQFEYTSRDPFHQNNWTLSFSVPNRKIGCTYLSGLERWDCTPPGAESL